MPGRDAILAVLVATVGVVALGAPAAGASALYVAQAAEATIVVEEATPLQAAYDYVVRVTTADGAPINGAQVTATAVGPDGSIGRILPLTVHDQDGRYRAVVEMPAPGTWVVRFAVADPVGNLEHVQEVALPADASNPIPAPVPPGTLSPGDDPAAGEAPTDAGANDATPDDEDTDAARPSSDDNGAAPLAALSAFIFVAAIAFAVGSRLRRKPAEDSTTTDPATAADVDANV